MSYSRTVSLWCDGVDCRMQFQGASKSLRRVRKEAKQYGWGHFKMSRAVPWRLSSPIIKMDLCRGCCAKRASSLESDK